MFCQPCRRILGVYTTHQGAPTKKRFRVCFACCLVGPLNSLQDCRNHPNPALRLPDLKANFELLLNELFDIDNPRKNKNFKQTLKMLS